MLKLLFFLIGIQTTGNWIEAKAEERGAANNRNQAQAQPSPATTKESLKEATKEPEPRVQSSRIGADIKVIKHVFGTAQVFGWRYFHFEARSFFVGGAGYAGQLTMGASGAFAMGGLLAGWELALSPRTRLEIALLAGGAGGFAVEGTTTALSGGAVIQPSVAYLLLLGRSVRTGIDAGYVWMPSSEKFTGITGTVRFDFLLDDVI
jgi:hypothetical protein